MISTRSKYTNAAIGREAKVLQDIHLPAKNIAIYQRDIEELRLQVLKCNKNRRIRTQYVL